MATERAIHTQRLCKAFRGNEVIHNCSFSVEQGEIYALLGVNGAGKTTLFKQLTGVSTPTSGKIQIWNKDIITQKNEILRDIGSIIDVPVFYDHLSARENLEIHLAYMGIDHADIDATLSKVGLPTTSDQPVSEFSLGMRQRLAIARAIIHQPRLLVLDEPVNGLDPVGIREMRDLFKSLANSHNVTILLSSHILSEIEHVADKIGIISNGSIVREITLSELEEDASINLEEYFLSVVRGGMQND